MLDSIWMTGSKRLISDVIGFMAGLTSLEINSMLILGPAGMILVGAIAIAYWRRRSSVGLKYFAIGGVFWAIAIAVKLLMDLTITAPLYASWQAIGPLGALVLLGLYVGLRTGILECCVPFLSFRMRSLRSISVDQATAVGVGFGATEAIVIAVPSLMQLITLMANPSILASLPPDQLQAVEAQLSQPTYIAAAAIAERAFTIPIHAFTTLFSFTAAVSSRWVPLLGAVLFKSALDGPLPLMQAYLGASGMGILLIEIFVAVMGLIALLGIIRQREKRVVTAKETEKD